MDLDEHPLMAKHGELERLKLAIVPAGRAAIASSGWCGCYPWRLCAALHSPMRVAEARGTPDLLARL
jgi:hypothetical protein